MTVISGALNPTDRGAKAHAKQMYESFRKQSKDIYELAGKTPNL